MSDWSPRKHANRTLLNALADLWDGVPDWRFGQLVMNLSREPGGFADTWEWTHADWYRRITALASEEAARGPSGEEGK